MNRIERFFDTARQARLESEMPIKVGAVVVRGSRVIKTEYNTPGKPKFLGSWSRHAEVRATLNINNVGAQIYIYREHGLYRSPMLARPCNHCQEWLKFVGIERAIYSIPEYPYFEVMEIK